MSKLRIEALEGSRLALKKINALLAHDSLSDSKESQTSLIDAHLQLEVVISLLKSEPEIQATENDLIKLLDARDDLSKLWDKSESTMVMSQKEFEKSLSSLFTFLKETSDSLIRQSALVSACYCFVGAKTTEASTPRAIESLGVVKDALNHKVDLFAEKFRQDWKDHEVFVSQLEIISPISKVANITASPDAGGGFLAADFLQENMPFLSRAMEINLEGVEHEARQMECRFYFMFISWACSDEWMGKGITEQKNIILQNEEQFIIYFAKIRQLLFNLIECQYRLMPTLSGWKFADVEAYKKMQENYQGQIETFRDVCDNFPIVGIWESYIEYKREFDSLIDKKKRKAAKVLEPYLEGKPIRQLLQGQAPSVELHEITKKWLPPLAETSNAPTESNHDTAPKTKATSRDDSETESVEAIELVDKSKFKQRLKLSSTESSKGFKGLATHMVRMLGKMLAATGVVMALLSIIGAVSGESEDKVIGGFSAVFFMGVAWLGYKLAKSSKSKNSDEIVIENPVVLN